MQKEKSRSYGMFITSMLIFGTVGIFRRYIPLSSELLAFLRGALGTAVLGGYLLIRKYKSEKATPKTPAKKSKKKSVKKKKPAKKVKDTARRNTLLKLMLTGVLIAVNWILLFEAYNYTSVATATLCYYMAPTIVILLSPLLLHERLTRQKGIAAAVSAVGMTLVSGFFESNMRQYDCRGILFGLGAAAFYAAVIILNKKTPMEDAGKKTAVQLASATLALLPYLLITKGFYFGNTQPAAYGLVAVLGIVHTGFAYLLYFGSMKGLRGQTVALLSYIDPVCALFLSALFLREPFSPLGTLGAFLILGAAAVCELGTPPQSEQSETPSDIQSQTQSRG